MATSIVKFYNQPLLTPERNSMFSESATNSNFEKYLTPYLKYTINDFQYIKHDLNITIKIKAEQSLINKTDKNNIYNYCSIKNSDDERTFYYFIISSKWTSQNTVLFELNIDSIATYWNLFDFDKKTNILRMHKDRFKDPGGTVVSGTTLIRVIDPVDEGIQVTKLKDNEVVINDQNHQTGLLWYLIYITETDASNLTANPVKCYLCANKALKTGVSAETTFKIKLDELDTTKVYYLVYGEDYGNTTDLSYTTSGTTVSRTIDESNYAGIIIYRNNAWTVKYTIVGGSAAWGYYPLTDYIQVSNFSNLYNTSLSYYNEFVDENKNMITQIGFNENAEKINYVSPNIATINTINKTDSRLMKIIELPYCPDGSITYDSTTEVYSFDTTVWEFSYAKNMLKLINLDNEFERTIRNIPIPGLYYIVSSLSEIDPTADRNDYLESKIYNSSFSSLKFVYDSFPKEYARERHTQTNLNTPSINLKFKQTNNINSKMLFKFDDVSGQTYKEIEDFEKYLLISRNNEVSIYSSNYLDYMRNGYNYDIKANQMQIRNQIANAILQGIGAFGQYGGSKISSQQKSIDYDIEGGTGQFTTTITKNISSSKFGISAAISAGVSAVQTILNVINTKASQELAMTQKLANLSAESASVAGADDLDLMRYYSGNKLRMLSYEPSKTMKELLLDMFYYAGYSCNYKGIPELYSRNNFNFIQCTPVFTNNSGNSRIYDNYLEDITARFELGLTVFHNTNDLEQTKNNTEILLTKYI